MKLSHIACFLAMTTLGLTGCQSSKGLLNSFIGGGIIASELPEKSSSRIQFVINDGFGQFYAIPNSAKVKHNTKTEGLVATRFISPLLPKEDQFKVGKMQLNMPKPITLSKNGAVIERYIQPSEEITISYSMGSNDGRTIKNCKIGGAFTPQPNTDYRATGHSDYKKCFILLEKFVKNPDGTTTLQPMRFE